MSNALQLTHTIMTDLPMVTLHWVHREPVDTNKITLPVYLNATRTDILFTIDLNIAATENAHSFYERGVALLASINLN